VQVCLKIEVISVTFAKWRLASCSKQY